MDAWAPPRPRTWAVQGKLAVHGAAGSTLEDTGGWLVPWEERVRGPREKGDVLGDRGWQDSGMGTHHRAGRRLELVGRKQH